MNNEAVDSELKSHLVSEYVSTVSTYPMVRKKIVHLQQKMGQSKGVVMEGRDIGSVVFPYAELKLFITASSETRAQRRHQELLKLGIPSNFGDVLENLKMRDFLDSTRENSPLKQVEDSILIDNTFMDINNQFNFVVELVEKKIKFL
jgi:cytidylate kinase